MWWFFYGLIMGACIMRLVMWVQYEDKAVAWYSWLTGALAILLLTLTAQHFFASYRELEPRAAWMGVLVMGIPAIIFAGVTTWLFLTM